MASFCLNLSEPFTSCNYSTLTTVLSSGVGFYNLVPANTSRKKVQIHSHLANGGDFSDVLYFLCDKDDIPQTIKIQDMALKAIQGLKFSNLTLAMLVLFQLWFSIHLTPFTLL